MTRKSATSFHECPAQGCTRKVPHDELACAPHWRKLPWRKRTNLTEAWRLNDFGLHSEALADALDWYRNNDADTEPESRGGYTTTRLEAGSDGAA
jgi:hypothetical protein